MKSVKKSFLEGWLAPFCCGHAAKDLQSSTSGCCKKRNMKNANDHMNFKNHKGDLATMAVETEALACSLADTELSQRKENLQKEVLSRTKAIQELENGYLLSFSYDERLLTRMMGYALAEIKCCPFLAIEMRLHSTNDVLLTLTGPPEAKPMLKEALQGLKKY